jgi:predicted amidohydrolase
LKNAPSKNKLKNKKQMKQNLKVAIFELNVFDSNIAENIKNLKKLISKNLKKLENTDLVIFPELFTTGYEVNKWHKLSEMSKIDLNKLRKITNSLNAYSFFSILFKENSKIYNRGFLLNKNGNIEKIYNKSHLFKPMKEDIYLTAGDSLSDFNLGKFKIGLAICYDLRFPEMFRKMALNGVNLFLVVAEWPKPRCDTLITLAKARAIENQAFLILSNRVGKDKSNNEFCGNSMLITPSGEVTEIKNPKSKNAILFSDISFDQIKNARKFISPIQERSKNIDF